MSKKPDTQVSPEVIQAIKDTKVPEKLHALITDAQKLAGSRRSFEEKADGMIFIADRFSNMMTPITPCKKGCNHCCYMAVAVSAFEADMIGRYLGRNKVEEAAVSIENYSSPKAREDSVEHYTGVPCSLLGQDGKCTVYQVRPFACRTHHNLGPDETNCVIVTDKSEALPTTPMVNIDRLLASHAMIFFEGRQSFADVRDWFPKV